MKINFTLNNENVYLDIEPKLRLLDVLRDKFNLISIKEGCGKGECGACTIFLDGKRVNSCLIPVFQVNGKDVKTLEYVKTWKSYKLLENSFLENGAVQCGFCFPGFIMSSLSLFNEKNGKLSKSEIEEGLGGNICRCTGYAKIVDSIYSFSEDKNFISLINFEFNNEK